MADPSAEVRIRLVIDDAATAVSDKITSSLGQVEAAQKKASAAGEHHGLRVGGVFVDMANKARSHANEVAAGVVTGQLFLNAFEAGYAKVKSVAHDAIGLIKDSVQAAQDGKKEVGEMSKALMMMAPGASMGAAKSMAKALHDEFRSAAIESGVSSESMSEAFDTIAERSHKSVDQVKRLTEQMAIAGKGVSGGLGGLSEGFAAVEKGMIRGTNPVVQLVAQTGLLQGNAKQVAAQMQKMSIDKQLEIGEKAVEKMAEKLKGMPMGFNAIKQSMTEMKKEMMEAMGEPILAKLTRIASTVRNFFMKHSDELVRVAGHIGDVVGEYMGRASDYFSKLVGITDAASTDIGQKMVDAIDAAKDKLDETWVQAQEAWEWIVGAANIIKAAFDATAGKLIESAKWWIEAAKKMAAAAGVTEAKQTPASGGATFTTESPTAALYHKQAMKAAGDLSQPLNVINDKILKFKAEMTAAGMNEAEWADINRGFQAAYDAAHTQAKEFDDAAAAMDPQKWVAAYNLAKKTHNDAMIKHGEEVLAQSVALQSVFGDAGKNIEGGYNDLAAHLSKLPGGGVLAGDLKARAAHDFSVFNGKDKGAAINMNGGQTFNMKQDFRDADPDRVFVAFKRDVAKAAVSRTQSRVAGVFGG